MSWRAQLFDPVLRRQRRRPALSGAIALAVATSVVLVVLAHPFAPGGTIVHARFAPQGTGSFATTPLHIFPNTEVRVHGVVVGTVQATRSLTGGGVDMALKIADHKLVIHRDARADLYYRTLLGRNVYIELDPGSSDAPAIGSAAIPASRTTSQVEPDQIFAALQPRPRRGQKQLLRELNQGLSTGAAHATITRLGPGLSATAAAAAATRGQNPGVDLPRLVDGGRRALAALAADERALTGLIDSADVALGVTAARHADLGSIVEQSPSTLAATRATMARLRTTLAVLDPVAQRLRSGVRPIAPGVRALTPTMRLVARLAPVAVPALRALHPALGDLRRMAVAGVPLLRELAPTLHRVSGRIVPFLDDRAATTKLRNYETIGPFFSAIASSAGTFDAGGYQQRFQPGQRLPAASLPTAACARHNVGDARPTDIRRACQALVSALSVAIGGKVRR